MLSESHTKTAKPQIGCYMSSKDAASLSAYAKKVGVKRPLLALLLVLRELNCRRLADLRDQHPYAGKGPELRRVTARVGSQALKVRFDAHISQFDIGSDEAAWILFQAELAEKWLENSLHHGNQD